MIKSNDLRSDRGTAMILTMGVLVIMVVMALEYATIMKLDEKVAFNYLETVNDGFSADAGCVAAIGVLRKYRGENVYLPDDNDYYGFSHTYQELAYDVLKEMGDMSQECSAMDDDVSEVSFDTQLSMSIGYDPDELDIFLQDLKSGAYVRGIVDEQSKININTARPEVVRALIRKVVEYRGMGGIFTTDVIDQLSQALDMTNNNDIANLHTVREMIARFGQLGLTGVSLEDIGSLVVGGNGYAGLQEYVTVHSESVSDNALNDADLPLDTYLGIANATSPINLNTARPIVLYSLIQAIVDDEFLSLVIADAIARYRNGDDGIPGTEDDDFFDGLFQKRTTSDHWYHIDLTNNPYGPRTLPDLSVFDDPYGEHNDHNGDGLDNDQDNYLYTGGAWGEFEVFLEGLVASTGGFVNDANKDDIMADLSMHIVRDFNQDGQISGQGGGVFADLQNNSSPICFHTDIFKIMSVGSQDHNDGRQLVRSFRSQIIQFQSN